MFTLEKLLELGNSARDIDKIKTKVGFIPEYIPNLKTNEYSGSFKLYYDKGKFSVSYNKPNYSGFWQPTPFLQSRDINQIIEFINKYSE